MSDTKGIASLVHGLCGRDSARREIAAEEIFRQGCELARPAAEKWLGDAELAGCLVLAESSCPEMTVGVAVQPSTFDRVRAASGSPRLAEVPPDQDAKEFELHFPRGVRLDILTTQEPGGTGTIARYLQKYGEGIQQVELLVRSMDRATEILRARFGLAPIYPAAREGADATRVNFYLVTTPLGKKVLVELVEAKNDSHA